MHFLPAVALYLSCLTMAIHSYPTGPGESECQGMTPNATQHGGDPTPTPAPFTVTVSNTTYCTGSTITVTLTANAADDFCEGFYAQARPTDANGVQSEDSLGIFTAGTGQKLINCFNRVGNSISHNEKSHKHTVTFTWQPAVSDTSNVVIRFTIVRHSDEYWLNVVSPQLSYATATCGAGRSSSPLMLTLVSTLILAVVYAFQ